MTTVIITFTKYTITFFMMLYTFACFNVFRHKSEEARKYVYFRQNLYMILIYTLSFLALIMQNTDIKYILFYFVSLVFLVLVILFYRIVYKKANMLITNNMCMLLSIGFLILTRISFDRAIRQFAITVFAVLITAVIPVIISRGHFFSTLKWVYALTGFLMLVIVLVFSAATNGAKLSIKIAGLTFQPSEFVKLIFVFAIASFLSKAQGFMDIVITTLIAAAHVIVLVLSKDLGGAVILFVVYLSMIYIATRNVLYLITGTLMGTVGALLGYKMFSHVRIRVDAFRNPFININDAGYQIAQSLFAIGTGGFFGMGLGQGLPTSIPVVAADFIYSAISEEFGTVFGICLILICLSCIIMFMNIAMKFEYAFYKFVAAGLGVLYGFQVFLTIGGVTKFIPLTGVTLPLVSYGGTSVLVSVVMFSIIQGLYIGRFNTVEPENVICNPDYEYNYQDRYNSEYR